ncbi:hypothetical protein HK101_006108, partial [Irineochytrium annulatum]
NKAATFPLQLLGFDVDPLNTVQFSNHTGYPTFSGDRLEGPQIAGLIKGLGQNGIVDEYSHVLAGYVGRLSSLEALVTLVEGMRKTNPRLTFVLDPVMGDEGRLYVPQELIPVYRDKLCPLADIITPNSFEVE